MQAEIAPIHFMSKIEARRCANDIKASLENARQLILDLHNREGWRALGFSSWRECVVAEFAQSQAYLYRQLDAAKIELEISPIGEKLGRLPEGPLRELKVIPPGQRKEVFEQAKAQSNGKNPTAAKVREIVDIRLARVNGKAAADPPDVAEARANGKIPATAVVEVHEPEETTDLADIAEEIAEEAAKTDDGLNDEDWLATLPLTKKLKGSQLKTFSQDALAYRVMDKPRGSFRHHAVRAVKATNGKGEYTYRLGRFLRIDHPKHWLVCPALEHGGCGGTGAVPGLGECPKCRQRGYRING